MTVPTPTTYPTMLPVPFESPLLNPRRSGCMPAQSGPRSALMSRRGT